MANFNQDEFNEFILGNNIIGFYEKPKRLSSGKESYWYANWRKILKDPFLLEQVIDYVINFAQDQGLTPRSFYGVPDGATVLGTQATVEWAKRSPDYGIGSHVISVGRKEPKSHGDEEDKYFLGGAPVGKTIVLEDVTTTGDSLKKGLIYVKNHAPRAELIAAIALTDRQERVVKRMGVPWRGITILIPRSYDITVKEKMEENFNIPYLAMSSARQLLPEAYQRQKPGEQIGALVEEELAWEGIPIKLR